MPSNDGVLAVARAFHVLIVGGSYGGLATALTLIDLCRGRLPRFNSNPDTNPPQHRIPVKITVVDERDGYFHLIGSPKSLACEELASESWTRFQDIPALKSPDISFIHGSVGKVDCGAKIAHILDSDTKSTRTESYDYLVAASGLRRVFPTVPRAFRREEFLQEVRTHSENVRNAQGGVVVVGGGAVGVEMAAELKILSPQQKVTLIHSRDRLLSSEPLPNDFASKVDSVLREGGVEVILGQRVGETAAVDVEDQRRKWSLTLSGGRQLTTGHVLSAISRCLPTSGYLPPKALNEDGYIKVHPSMQFSGNVPNADHHFAVGDLAAWNGIKRCGGAMHMGHYAGINLHQQMLAEGGGGAPNFRMLQPFPDVIGLVLGKKAVTWTEEEGTRYGEDLMANLFGDDMGNAMCRNYMKFDEPCPE